jgi:DNA-binding NtrC family response regulator
MKRLLLLHPDGEVNAAVERTLSRIGVTIEVAASADDVLLQLDRSNHHSVVVLDHMLAGTRLTEIIELLKAPRDPKPIVIVTSTEDTDLDPNIVSLIVPPTYDVPTLVGVILACATDSPDNGAASAQLAGSNEESPEPN